MSPISSGQNVVSVLTDMNSPTIKLNEPKIIKKALAVLSSAGAFFAKKSENGLLHLLCKEGSDNPIYGIDLRPTESGKYVLRSAYLAGDGSLQGALKSISGNTVPVPEAVFRIVFEKSPINKYRTTDITGWGSLEGIPLIKYSIVPKNKRKYKFHRKVEIQ